MKKRFIYILITLSLLAIFLDNAKNNAIKFDTTVPSFTQLDRALGETADDTSLRACGANETKTLFKNGAIVDQNSYNAILKDLANKNGKAFQFMDMRTLTRGTIPYLIANFCASQMMSSVVAVSITDGKGVPSVAFAGSDRNIHYYHNTGGGHFQLNILNNIPAISVNPQNVALLFLDMNKDGLPDLVVADVNDKKIYTVLNDGNGNFNSPPIIYNDPYSYPGLIQSVTTGDLTRDGRDDIILTNRFQAPGNNQSNLSYPIRILHNTGVAPFWKEVTAESLPILENNWTGKAYESQTNVPNGIWYASYVTLVMDLDHDGWPDILEIGDGQASHMLWSSKKGSIFVDKSYEAGIEKSTAGMGITPINLEGGTNPTLFVSDAATTFTQQCEKNRYCAAWHGNRLYVTGKSRTFSEEASRYGLQNTGWAFGAIFSDFGLNGYPGLVVGTGDFASGRADETFQATFDKPYLMTYNGTNFYDTSLQLLRAWHSPGITNKVLSADFDGDNVPDLLFYGYESHNPYLLLNRTVGKSSSILLHGLGLPGKATEYCTDCMVQIHVQGHKPYTLWNEASQQNFGGVETNVPLTIGFGGGNWADIKVTYPDGVSKLVRIYPNKAYLIKEPK